jgi:hypothetical protein
VPREGRERKTQLFQPTRDPTANMHCDERQEEKGVVEGKSHNTCHYEGEKGKETERPKRKKNYQKSGVIQIAGKCFHRKCTGESHDRRRVEVPEKKIRAGSSQAGSQA